MCCDYIVVNQLHLPNRLRVHLKSEFRKNQELSPVVGTVDLPAKRVCM